MSRIGKGQVQPGDQLAGNGILNRRMFLDGASSRAPPVMTE